MALRTHTRVMLPAGRHLSVNDRTVEPLYPVHWHSHFEIEIILGGEKIEPRFIVREGNRYAYLSLNLDNADFKAGDKIKKAGCCIERDMPSCAKGKCDNKGKPAGK